MNALKVGVAWAIMATVLGSSSAWAQQPSVRANQAVKKAPSHVPMLQGFSVVLVLGDLQSGAPAENVPAAARKALDDMKDFLPYKSYRLLDTAWILGSNSMRATTSRLGSGEEQYEVRVEVRGGSPVKLSEAYQTQGTKTLVGSTSVQVRFVLRQPRESAESVAQPARLDQLADELTNLRAARVSLEREMKAMSEKYGARHPDVRRAEHQLADLTHRIAVADEGRQAAAGTSTVIDTSFNMDIGETVVVGTSRVRGDKALIALLTAVPRAK